MEGYIKLHRKILENAIFRKPKVSHLFNYCLLRANWSDKTICWNGQPLVVERGSFITGRKQIALETGLSEQNVRYALRTLHTFGMVKPLSEKSTSKFTYLTVCNYNDYQHFEDEGNQQSNQQVTSNQPASNQQVTTDKNNNNNNTKETNKNIKEDFENWWIYWKSLIWKHEGKKQKAWEYYQQLKFTPEQITESTKKYLESKRAVNQFHMAAEGFLNPKGKQVQYYLEYQPPPKQSAESDRSVPIEISWKNQIDSVRRNLAQMNKHQAQQYWEEIPESWRTNEKIAQMFSEKN
jgi:DNA-binding transcriptional regulator GbsR (MarR family)